MANSLNIEGRNGSFVDDFRCPACGGGLTGTEELRCPSCDRIYPISDGIIDFRVTNRSYYFNPVPSEDMRKLTEAMPHESWARTVARFAKYTKRPADWIDNLTSDGRYAWKVLLDLRPDAVLLDVGCGLGNLSYNLAPHVGKVYAMDLTHERIAFARRRFALAGDRNHVVPLAGGDGDYLPFPAGALDYVVLSGVLEWIGDSDPEQWAHGGKAMRLWRMVRSCFGKHSARAAQLRFLREIRRVLRPDGQLFIAIENRLGYRYFLGDPDHHSGLRYSSLMPRVLANLYSIYATRRPYRTYTYSTYGHRRLLREAGFTSTEFYGLLPGYTHLTQIVCPESSTGRWRMVKARTTRERLTQNRYVVPAYGIVAGGRPRSRRLLDGVLDDVEKALTAEFGPSRVDIVDYRVTGKAKGLLTGNYAGKPIQIKLPFSPAAVEGAMANAAFLTTAKAGFARDLVYVPRCLASGVVGGVRYFVEERCAGSPLRKESGRLGRAGALAISEAALHDLNPQPTRADAFDGHLLRARVMSRLALLSPLVDDPGLLSALERFFQTRLASVKLVKGVEHGDFGHDNILAKDRRLSGLVDWESASLLGLPIMDVFSYLEAAGRLDDPTASLHDTIPLLVAREWCDESHSAFLERQYSRLGVDPKDHGVLVYLYWLQHVSSQVAYDLAYDSHRVERDVVGVVRQILKGAE